ncbi:MAG: hypothetical protein AABW68_02405 [archaeon]
MRSTDWMISLAFALFAYLFFVNFESFRLIGMGLFSFLFAYYISSDEWRLGRAVMLSLIPLFLSVIFLFLAPFFWATVVEESIRGPLLVSAAYGFLVMLFLSVLVGIPLACAGVMIRHYRFVRVTE